MYKKKLENLFTISKTPKTSFKKRLIFYHETFEKYKEWRNNFRFPKTTYLSKLDTLKPRPNNALINDLATCINELRGEFLNLKDYRPVLLFKLFLFYFSEAFKAKNKIKINKSIGGPFGRWATGGKTPTRRDISSIMSYIVEDIFKFENSFSAFQKRKKTNQIQSKRGTRDGHWIYRGEIRDGKHWAEHWENLNFKWDKIWMPYAKKYIYQSKFALADHYTASTKEKSLNSIEKSIKKFENLTKKNNPKDTFQIVNLFYELEYCKSFDEVERIFKINTKSEVKINQLLNWQRLESEQVPEDNKDFNVEWEKTFKLKKRVFPKFTFKNMKEKFDKDKFLKEILITKDIKLSLIRAMDADDELIDGLEYDELLPEYNLILPAYTSGTIFNLLNSDLSFITVARCQTIIEELAETNETCLGIIKVKKINKHFLVSYTNDRQGITYCKLLYLLKKDDVYKKPILHFMKEIKEWNYHQLPDTILLNEEFKWNFSQVKKTLGRLAKGKIEDQLFFNKFKAEDKKDNPFASSWKKGSVEKTISYLKEKGGYDNELIACKIYTFNQTKMQKLIDDGKGSGSVRFNIKTFEVSPRSLIDEKPFIEIGF